MKRLSGGQSHLRLVSSPADLLLQKTWRLLKGHLVFELEGRFHSIFTVERALFNIWLLVHFGWTNVKLCCQLLSNLLLLLQIPKYMYAKGGVGGVIFLKPATPVPATPSHHYQETLCL